MSLSDNDDISDTIEYRRKHKIRGLRGTDWWRYKDGVPPEDNNDYVWKGSYWEIDND